MTLLPEAFDRPPTAPRTVPFAQDLGRFGDRPALLTADGELTYRQLAAGIEDMAARLGTARRLVLIAGGNHVDAVVTYLAALAAGHVALLVPPGHAGSVAAVYDPDVVTDLVDGTWRLDVRRDLSAHDLHPDLALLMSTSGSTGSPKLVRLSRENLVANAESIATYLRIRDTDRAATTLPMHYCYGLSVINSHLLRGAGLILTGLSVVDACFWDLFGRHRGSAFAGVPHTFDLLDSVGFADLRLPHLRYVTQAGGRLAPERVRRYAELGLERGWDLFVMYGQTEATARMAYLPPDLARSHPHTVGIPIPGGSFTIEPLGEHDDPAVGELVYAGPNVMLGYAETPADLGLGRTVTMLRTGDLARPTDDGLYEIVGRRHRFVKIFGLRIDLQHLEAMLAERGVTACCTGHDGELVVAVEGSRDVDDVRRLVAQECGLPVRTVQVHQLAALPKLPSGKPDYLAVAALAVTTESTCASVAASGAAVAELRDLFAEILSRPDATEDSTFVSLGGDSLSYVEMTVRLEQALGHVPPNWHITPIRDLRPAPRRRRFLGHTAETSVLLRAIAIVCIVAAHAHWFRFVGGAHVLLAVAGFNFARFQLATTHPWQRLRQQLASVARIAVPSMIWIAVVFALTDLYSVANVFLVNGFVGPPEWTPQWRYWFIEVLVWTLLLAAALLTIPWVGRMERRRPFGFAMTLVACGLITRFGVVDLGVPHTKPAFWLFALGWATARATTSCQRVVVTAAILASVPGYWGNTQREAVMIGGMTLLVWATGIPFPSAISRVAGILASGSLYIYLTHWHVFPLLRTDSPALAVAASLVVGVAAWIVADRVTEQVRRLARRITSDGRRALPAVRTVPRASVRSGPSLRSRPGGSQGGCRRAGG